MSDRDLRIRVLLEAMDKASGPIRAIREESRQAGAAIRSTRSDIVRLEKAQADLKGFRDLKRGLADTERRMEAARTRAASLARELEQADKPTKKLTSDFSRAKREAADLGREFDRQRLALQGTRDRLRDVGISTRELGAGEKKLASDIRDANRRLEEQKRHLADIQRNSPRRMTEHRAGLQADRELEQRFDKRAERVKRTAGLIGTAVGVAATAAGIEAGKEAASYESRLTSIGQKANLVRDQAQQLGDALRNLAPTVGRLPEKMAEGADTLAGIGLFAKYDEIQDPNKRFREIMNATTAIMTPVGKAATAYEAVEDDLVRSVAAGVLNLKIPAERAKRILDIMAAGDNAGAFGMAAMSAELPALTGLLEALGQTGEKALGTLVTGFQIARTNAGSDNEAANNLRNLLLKINAKETIKNFKDFGVDLPAALKKAKTEGRDLLEVVAELTNQATKGDTSKIGYIFGDQQAQMAVQALIGKMKEYKALRDQVMKSHGTVDRQFDERMKDTASKWDRMKSLWSKNSIEFGVKVKPITNGVLDAINAALEGKELDLGRMKWRSADEAKAKWDAFEKARKKVSIVEDLKTFGRWAQIVGPAQALIAPMLYGANGEKLREQKARPVPKVAPKAKPAVWPAAKPQAPTLLTAAPKLARPVPIVQPRSPAPMVRQQPVQPRPAVTPPAVNQPRPAPAPIVRQQPVQPPRATPPRAVPDPRPDLARANALARQYQAQALADQRAASARSLMEGQRHRDRMRQLLSGNSEFVSAGRNMMAGIELGMNARAPGLFARMREIGGQLTATFRNFMQIRSPSRVFASHGRFLMDGLALGIDGAARRPIGGIDRVARAMSAAAIVGLPSPALAAVPVPPAARPYSPAAENGASAPRAPITRIEPRYSPIFRPNIAAPSLPEPRPDRLIERVPIGRPAPAPRALQAKLDPAELQAPPAPRIVFPRPPALQPMRPRPPAIQRVPARADPPTPNTILDRSSRSPAPAPIYISPQIRLPRPSAAPIVHQEQARPPIEERGLVMPAPALPAQLVTAFASLNRLADRIALPPAVRDNPPPPISRPSLIAPPIATSGPGRASPAVQGITFTGPITIEIHQQPGESADQLAHRFEQLLEQRARSAAARNASSYEDLD